MPAYYGARRLLFMRGAGRYGPELITNAYFDSGLSGWIDASTPPSSVVWSNGLALFQTNGILAARLRQQFSTIAGRVYQVRASALGGTGSNSLSVGTVAGGVDLLSQQTFMNPASFTFTATGSVAWLNFFSTINGRVVDYGSVRRFG